MIRSPGGDQISKGYTGVWSRLVRGAGGEFPIPGSQDFCPLFFSAGKLAERGLSRGSSVLGVEVWNVSVIFSLPYFVFPLCLDCLMHHVYCFVSL